MFAISQLLFRYETVIETQDVKQDLSIVCIGKGNDEQMDSKTEGKILP